MIFVTVGTDGPFDRLVRAVDRWAGEVGRTDVFAQIGRTALRPRFMRYAEFLEPTDFHKACLSSAVIVSHAGMGTLLTALQHNKPLLVMPRLASLGEQRNEHQLATARRLMAKRGIAVAFDDEELLARLARIDTLTASDAIGPFAQSQLIQAIQAFIHHGVVDSLRSTGR